MTNVNHSGLIGSMINLLNNTGSLADPYNGTRTGSFFFGPNQTLVFQKYMPKGQVIGTNWSEENPSFGRSYQRDEYYTLEVYFYTKSGDVGSGTTIKDRELVLDYLRRIRNIVRTKSNEFGDARLFNIGEVDPPFYLRDDNIYVGMIPFTFLDVTSE